MGGKRRCDEPADRHPQDEQRQRERAPEAGVDTEPRPSERLKKVLNGADPAHRPAYQSRTGDADADQCQPKNGSDREPQRPREMRLDEREVHEDEEQLHQPPSPPG